MHTTRATVDSRTDTRSLPDMLWEVVDLAGGVTIMLLPLLTLAVPSVALFVVLPALVLLAVAAVPAVAVAAVVLPVYLLVRAVRSVRARLTSRRMGRGVPPRPAGATA